MKKIFNPAFIFVISVIFFGSLLRVIPHLPNFTPVAAIALFGGTYLNKKWLSFVIPLLCLLFSDIIIGFHDYMFSVYLSFAITVILGFIIRNKINPYSVVSASIASSLIFYFITNFAVWFESPFFTQDFNGLLNSYFVALPFLRNSILGDLFFNSIFFGMYYFFYKKVLIPNNFR